MVRVPIPNHTPSFSPVAARVFVVDETPLTFTGMDVEGFEVEGAALSMGWLVSMGGVTEGVSGVVGSSVGVVVGGMVGAPVGGVVEGDVVVGGDDGVEVSVGGDDGSSVSVGIGVFVMQSGV